MKFWQFPSASFPCREQSLDLDHECAFTSRTLSVETLLKEIQLIVSVELFLDMKKIKLVRIVMELSACQFFLARIGTYDSK